MSSRDLRSYIAIVGGLILVLGLGYFASAGVACLRGQCAAQHDPQQPKAIQTEPPLSAVQQKDGTNKEAECAHKSGGDYNECMAQLRSTRAAQTQADYARYSFWVSLGTLALTGAAAGAAYWAARIAKRALFDLERSFVFLKHVNFRAMSNGNTAFSVVWENSGNTPAKHVLARINWGNFPPRNIVGFDFPDLGTEPSVLSLIGPKSTLNMADVEMPSADMAQLIAGATQIFVWGWIEYSDILARSARYRTEFCYRVVPVNAGPDQFELVTRAHTEHNGADEDCIKKPTPYRRPG